MPLHRIPFVLAVAATLSCTPPLEAQVYLQSWTAPSINSLKCVGDVDADGVNDVAVAYNTLDVYSGRTGVLLRQVVPQAPYVRLPETWNVGDVDGDGRADLMFPLGDLNFTILETRVVSGATGATIHAFPGAFGFGWAASGIGDLDGDGKNEILLGYPFATVAGMPNAGRIDLIDGATGTVSRSHVGTAPNQQLGGVQRVGDFDGDGYDDYFTLDDFDALRIHSGFTGTQLFSTQYFLAYMPVHGIGDFNADGFDDFGFNDYHPLNNAFVNSYFFAGPSGALRGPTLAPPVGLQQPRAHQLRGPPRASGRSRL